MANNPFAPAAPAAATAAPADVASTEGTETKPKRNRNAKALTKEQYSEILVRSKAGETPKQIADDLGIERNQAYNHMRKVKKTLQAILDDETSTPETKAAIQAELDSYPVREFGSTAGEKRASASTEAIGDLLASLGVAQ